MNIHTVPTRGVGAFVNALFPSTAGECCVLSICSCVKVWGGCCKRRGTIVVGVLSHTERRQL